MTILGLAISVSTLSDGIDGEPEWSAVWRCLLIAELQVFHYSAIPLNVRILLHSGDF